MKFSRIAPSDIPKIIDLFKVAYPAAWKKTSRTFSVSHVSRRMREARQKDVLVKIVDKGTMAGFGWAGKDTDFLGNKYGEIKLILVHPAYQNQKLGTRILDYLEKRLKAKDLRLFVLSFNRATKLYQHKGYTVFGQYLRKTNH